MSPSSRSTSLPSLLSSLSIRSTTSKTTIGSSRLGQIRTQATSRRTTKRLRVFPSPSAPKPHPSATTHRSQSPPSALAQPQSHLPPAPPPQIPGRPSPFSRPINPSATSISFTPPPSSPTPYHTPSIFLPPTDPRRVTLATSHRASNPYLDATRRLPPAVRKPYEKVYHLTKEQIEDMRELRAADPEKWTRGVLAKKFGCTEFFVGIAAPSSEARREWNQGVLQHAGDGWGPKRRKAREDRKKRREVWAMDA